MRDWDEGPARIENESETILTSPSLRSRHSRFSYREAPRWSRIFALTFGSRSSYRPAFSEIIKKKTPMCATPHENLVLESVSL